MRIDLEDHGEIKDPFRGAWREAGSSGLFGSSGFFGLFSWFGHETNKINQQPNKPPWRRSSGQFNIHHSTLSIPPTPLSPRTTFPHRVPTFRSFPSCLAARHEQEGVATDCLHSSIAFAESQASPRGFVGPSCIERGNAHSRRVSAFDSCSDNSWNCTPNA